MSKKRPAHTSPADEGMPAFMRFSVARQSREVSASVPTWKTVDEYLAWSVHRVQMNQTEVGFRLVDHALSEYVRRDAAWQKEKKRRAQLETARTEPGASPPPLPAGAKRDAAPAGAASRTETGAAGSTGKAA